MEIAWAANDDPRTFRRQASEVSHILEIDPVAVEHQRALPEVLVSARVGAERIGPQRSMIRQHVVMDQPPHRP